MYRVILASSSPRRREILNQVGIEFEVISSSKEEIAAQQEPADLVMELAAVKAEDVASCVDGPAIIIGADTVVVYNGRILGKPKDYEDAFQMIETLQGDTHTVYTGVSMVVKEIDNEVKKYIFYVATDVSIVPMSTEQIHNYTITQEPYDKAGAYAIQGSFAQFIKEIHGDYYNVVGFPICRIIEEANMAGIDLKKRLHNL